MVHHSVLSSAKKAAMLLLLILLFLISCKEKDAGQTPHATLRSIAEMRDNGDLSTALDLYKQVLSEDHPGMNPDSATLLLSDALVQAYNTSLYIGDPASLLAWIDSIRTHPAPFVRENLMRDIFIVRGMLLSRTGAEEEAMKTVQNALKMPIHRSTHKRLMRDYLYAASVCYNSPELEDSVESWLRRSLSEAEAAQNPPGTSYIRSALAGISIRKGHVDEALTLLETSLDESRQTGDLQSQANVINQIAQLYESWGLEREADRFASEGTSILPSITAIHPTIPTETYTLKAATALSLGTDSCAYWLARADSAARDLPYNMGPEDIDMVRGEYYETFPDSLDKALKAYSRVASQSNPMKQPQAWYRLARLHDRRGEKSLADAALDSMMKSSAAAPELELTADVWPWTLSYFLAKGEDAKVIETADLMTRKTDKDQENRYRQALISGVVDFHNYKANARVETERYRATNRLFLWLSVTLGLIIVILAGALWIFIAKKKVERHRDTLAVQLAEQKEHTEENTRHYARVLNALSLAEAREILSRDEVKKLEESKLQQVFDTAYPDFNISLKKNDIQLSRREKTLAIMIILGFDTTVIAGYLNIAKQSINIARYRLRNRLRLEHGEDLTAYLQSLAQPGASLTSTDQKDSAL